MLVSYWIFGVERGQGMSELPVFNPRALVGVLIGIEQKRKGRLASNDGHMIAIVALT